jgi:uncharacterized protein YrzB (UPF0473 family)
MSEDIIKTNAPEIVYIPDEEGNAEEFEVLLKFELGDKKYIVLEALEQNEESEHLDVFVFYYEEVGDDLELFTIEDEEEWKLVGETVDRIYEELEEK